MRPLGEIIIKEGSRFLDSTSIAMGVHGVWDIADFIKHSLNGDDIAYKCIISAAILLPSAFISYNICKEYEK